MRKIYHLSTCSTNKRIIKEVNPDASFTFQDIKKEQITKQQLSEMREMAGSYEVLFSRKSMKYKAFGLKDKQLSEQDYERYILEEYTFLKRPVFIIDDEIFIGNTKENIALLSQKMLSVVKS